MRIYKFKGAELTKHISNSFKIILIAILLGCILACSKIEILARSFSSEQNVEAGFGDDPASKIAYESVVRNQIEPFIDSETIYEKVYFGPNSAILSETAKEILWKKILWLEENPNTVLVIQGHSDTLGKEVDNLIMAQRRAESVKSFLVSLGVNEERLMAVSYGEEYPADTSSTEESHAKNRRVTFSIQ